MSYTQSYQQAIRQQAINDLQNGQKINYQYDNQLNNYSNNLTRQDNRLGTSYIAYANKANDFAKYDSIVSQRMAKATIMTETQQKAKDAALKYKYYDPATGQQVVPSAYEDVIFKDQYVPTYTTSVQLLTNTQQYQNQANQLQQNVKYGEQYQADNGYGKIFQQQKQKIFDSMKQSYQINNPMTTSTVQNINNTAKQEQQQANQVQNAAENYNNDMYHMRDNARERYQRITQQKYGYY